MFFKLFKAALLTVVAGVVVLNVGAAFGLSYVVFPALMEKSFFDQSVVLDDNTRVYVSSTCLDDWASKHTTLRAREGKISEAYRLQYKAYECDTRAYWKGVFGK